MIFISSIVVGGIFLAVSYNQEASEEEYDAYKIDQFTLAAVFPPAWGIRILLSPINTTDANTIGHSMPALQQGQQAVIIFNEGTTPNFRETILDLSDRNRNTAYIHLLHSDNRSIAVYDTTVRLKGNFITQVKFDIDYIDSHLESHEFSVTVSFYGFLTTREHTRELKTYEGVYTFPFDPRAFFQSLYQLKLTPDLSYNHTSLFVGYQNLRLENNNILDYTSETSEFVQSLNLVMNDPFSFRLGLVLTTNTSNEIGQQEQFLALNFGRKIIDSVTISVPEISTTEVQISVKIIYYDTETLQLAENRGVFPPLFQNVFFILGLIAIGVSTITIVELGIRYYRYLTRKPVTERVPLNFTGTRLTVPQLAQFDVNTLDAIDFGEIPDAIKNCVVCFKRVEQVDDDQSIIVFTCCSKICHVDEVRAWFAHNKKCIYCKAVRPPMMRVLP